MSRKRIRAKQRHSLCLRRFEPCAAPALANAAARRGCPRKIRAPLASATAEGVGGYGRPRRVHPDAEYDEPSIDAPSRSARQVVESGYPLNETTLCVSGLVVPLSRSKKWSLFVSTTISTTSPNSSRTLVSKLLTNVMRT